MDSGDEEGGEESGESCEEELPPLPASAADVRSFAEMLRMAPRLQASAASMPVQELANICVAAGRVKFYDAALLNTVSVQLMQRLSSGQCSGLAHVLVEVIASLAGLNAYHRELFSATAQWLAADGTAAGLAAPQLKVLVAAFKSVRHPNDAAFEALVRRERQARYEAAKEDIMRDELQRRWVR